MVASNQTGFRHTEKRTVLVVDDELINREILSAGLADEYLVLQASNDQEALKIIQEYGTEISLILLDLLMPVMSGMMMLKQLKDSPDYSGIPVIVMTADHDAEVASLELGAIDFIPKPYPRFNIIQARIHRIIELSEDRSLIRSTERDSLTGLYTREFFYSYAESFDQHHKNEAMDAIVLDIDRFHIINERFGRAFADEILQVIAVQLQDIKQSIGGIICRREADTFLLYCPHQNDYSQILARVLNGVKSKDNALNRVRLRMGVYPEVNKSIDVEQRFDRAKAAADTIRSNYTQNIAFYNKKLHEHELFAEQLIEDFDKAIKEQQFKVYYQPKYNVTSATPFLASAEALIRWEHPRLGLVSPGVFIPLFEENRMIQQLDHYVWEHAAAQVKAWKDQYGISIPVSVNVSRVDLYDPEVIQTFKDLLGKNNLDASDLVLEITESAYSDDEAYIIDTVEMFRELGLRVEMDDFGTGYSSLGMISRLPLDALKLDMAFVRNAFSDQKDTRMIELIIDIADYLGVPVIAEGVETQEQNDALQKMGCHIIQGYYYSKPVPPNEFSFFIEQKLSDQRQESANAASGAGSSPMQKPGLPEARHKGFNASSQPEHGIGYARLAQALVADYFSIYYVNLQTDHFIEYRSHKEYESLDIEKSGEDFFTVSRNNVLRVMYPQDQKAFLAAFTKENLQRELDQNGVFTISYRLLFDGVPTWVNMKAIRMVSKNDPHAVIGVSKLDPQTKHHEEYEQVKNQSLSYFRIVQALSQDYYSIYVVNTETDEFVEYSSNTKYQELEVEQNGLGFFEDCRRNVIKLVHPDDLKKALSIWEKDRLLAELDSQKTVSVTYRLMFDASAVYINCKVIRMTGDDNKYIVIGISNVDAQIKRDLEFAKDLKDAKDAAQRDALTGVRSRLAFTEKQSAIDANIQNGEQEPFAVVVFDINGLKTVNDTQGHNAGDRLIKDACTIICNQFKHSPVFRIGGDEFTAILQGSDYQNRDQLIEQFISANNERKETRGILIACGIAQWNQSQDELFERVFERADTLMYHNKKALKS